MGEGFECFFAVDAVEKLDDGIFLEHLTCEKDVSDVQESFDSFGTPEKDTLFWTRGSCRLSDGVMCEKYAIEALTGKQISEEIIITDLEKKGLYNREKGSTLYDMGSYSESVGLQVSFEHNLSVRDLCELLDNDQKVICAISSISASFPEISMMPGLAADHYVEVIGVKETTPGKKGVILNDPDASSGGSYLDLDVFIQAWEKGGRFAMIVDKSEG